MDSYARKYQYIAAGVMIFVLAGAAFYFFDFRVRPDAPDVIQDETANNDIVADVGDEPGLVTLGPADTNQTGEKALPPYTGQPLRELGADPELAASVGGAILEKYQKNLSSIADRLEKNPRNADEWLAVAYIKKLFNNYIGTRDAWEYAKVVAPDNPIAHFNLGELYGYELKDPVKAEENYKAALRLNPYSLDYYVGLANFYEDVLRDLDKAEKTLLSALDKIPNTEVNLFTEIGAFYRDQKNYEKALEYFEKALGAADLLADPGIKKSIQNEIDYIRSKSLNQPEPSE